MEKFIMYIVTMVCVQDKCLKNRITTSILPDKKWLPVETGSHSIISMQTLRHSQLSMPSDLPCSSLEVQQEHPDFLQY